MGIPEGKRVLYPAGNQNFQAKVWVGGDSVSDAEYLNNKVKAAVAYLRSMDNRLNSGDDSARRDDEEFDPDTYQLQQWRRIDPDATVPMTYDGKWQLEQLHIDSAYGTHHFRKPRPEIVNDSFTFYINKASFVPGPYTYKVISLEKLETKLHLMSSLEDPAGNPPYNHIEDDIVVENIWDNIGYVTGYNDSPIADQGTFTAEIDDPNDVTITISNMSYSNPDIDLSDFVICIKPDSEW